MLGLLTTASLALAVSAQQIGKTPNVLPKLTTQQCTTAGGCKTRNTLVTIDALSRPIKDIATGASCLNADGSLKHELCSTVEQCAANCALEGVNYPDYGISTDGDALTMRIYLGSGNKTRDVSPRAYLMEPAGNDYDLVQLTNQEFTFTVDVSNLPCGMNGALYMSEMNKTGSRNAQLNPAGAAYGTGYCDAQCYSDSFINGVADLSGKGTCCQEMDIWEANIAATQLTPHPCNVTGNYECTGELCSFNGVCDQYGCGFNPYGTAGAHNFYGPGTNYTVDTNNPVTVVTQFHTVDGTATGKLSKITRFYVQDGKIIHDPSFEFNGETFSAQTAEYCGASSYEDRFDLQGGMAQIGTALERGMVLIFALWNTNSGNMSWLDAGSSGPCNPLYDSADEIEANDPHTSVTFSNIRWGDFGTTYVSGAEVVEA